MPEVISRRLRGVLVPGILADRCDSCGEVILSSVEGDRASRIADVILETREREKAA